MPPKPERKRLSLDMDDKAKNLLDELATKTGSATYAELSRKAFALLNAVTEHTARGGRVVFRHPDGTDELLHIL